MTDDREIISIFFTHPSCTVCGKKEQEKQESFATMKQGEKFLSENECGELLTFALCLSRSFMTEL